MEAGSHIEFCKYGGQNEHPLRRLKNEISMLWSSSVTNLMLVDKSAHYPPSSNLSPLGPGLSAGAYRIYLLELNFRPDYHHMFPLLWVEDASVYDN